MLWEILWRYKNSLSLSFCLTFSLISILWQRNPLAKGVNYFGQVSDRISGAMNSGLSLPGSLWVELDKYRELERKYEVAQKMVEEFRLEKDKFDSLVNENEKLRRALDYPLHVEYPEVRAEVLGVRLNSISPRLIVNKGSRDGIKAFMPVIAHSTDADQNHIRAIVGIIASVDSTTSVIQPIMHPGFQAGVRMPETGQWSILSGNSGSITEVLLTYIAADGNPDKATYNQPDVEIKKSLTIVTSGEGGIFPSGIPVGIVTREGRSDGEFKTAFVKPFVNISSLDNVIIIMKTPARWGYEDEKRKLPEDNLFTEFGEPVYSELTAKEKPKAKVQKVEEKKEEVQEPKSEEPKKQLETPGRRLQNVTVPQ